MKRYVILLSYLFVCFETVHAVRALRVLSDYVQADGTHVSLILCGDESFSYYLSPEGAVVVSNGSAFVYAEDVSPDGLLKPSKVVCHDRADRTQFESEYVSERLQNFSEQRMLDRVLRCNVASDTRSIGSVARASIKPVGQPRVPVVLVQFKDKKFSFDSDLDVMEYYERFLNGENYKGSNSYGSVRDYFVAQSDGRFRPKFDVYGVVTLDNDYSYYGSNINGVAGKDVRYTVFISESIGKAFSASDDLSVYDSNSDKIVDLVYFIFAGLGEANGGDPSTLWPKEINGWLNVKVGDYLFNSAAMCNEMIKVSALNNGQPVHDGIGIMCHELSHALGLPDFYDTKGNAFGMDRWSLMDYGCYNSYGFHPCGYTAYERDFMGWRQLALLDSPSEVTLYPIVDSLSVGYKVVSDANPMDYYILENRQNIGWDEKNLGHGMMVTHVHYSSAAWNNNIVNTDPAHQLMTIIPADGTLGRSHLSDFEGDLFPGRTDNHELTDFSFPCASTYSGDSLMHKPITDISEMADGSVRFSFMKNATDVHSAMMENEYHIDSENGVLSVFANGKPVDVYTMSGMLVLRAKSAVEQKLESGIYILKVGDTVSKITIP